MEHQAGDAADAREKALNKHLDSIGWGLFLVMLGCLWLAPQGMIPEGIGLVGAGLIMLGINAARYMAGIKTSGGTIVLGVMALVGGVAQITGAEDLPVVAILLIVAGATTLLKPLFDRKRAR